MMDVTGGCLTAGRVVTTSNHHYRFLLRRRCATPHSAYRFQGPSWIRWQAAFLKIEVKAS